MLESVANMLNGEPSLMGSFWLTIAIAISVFVIMLLAALVMGLVGGIVELISRIAKGLYGTNFS